MDIESEIDKLAIIIYSGWGALSLFSPPTPEFA
jgi:hypothetical protein